MHSNVKKVYCASVNTKHKNMWGFRINFMIFDFSKIAALQLTTLKCNDTFFLLTFDKLTIELYTTIRQKIITYKSMALIPTHSKTTKSLSR